jgi:hypothetical protein
MTAHTCQNCGNTYTENFCNYCGQKHIHRYSVGHVAHELLHVFTHADKGIFALALNLLKKPGLVALDLVEGRRKKHFNLFQYLLLIVGFTTFLIVKTNFVERMFTSMNGLNEAKMAGPVAVMQHKMALLLQKYNNILQMVLIPVFAFFSWLYIGRKKYNYAENIVLHTASSAQTNTIAIVTTLLILVSPSKNYFTSITLLSLLIGLWSFALCYRQFYGLSWLKAIGWAILVYTSTYVVQVVLTAVGVVVYMLLQH